MPEDHQPPTALLSVHGVSKAYNGTPAVQEVSLQVASGEILVLLGPSGSGKSSVLKLIAGFEDLDAGQIKLHGQSIAHLPPEKRGIGMVFQDYALFPHMTAEQNVVFALHHLPRAQRGQAARDHLQMLGMAQFAQRYPHELSGGQQQRVAVARTFASSPRLVLLDEPFSSIDESMRAHARREIRAILRQSGLGVIMVTHDCTEALSFADKICVLNQGRVVQYGTPEDIYLRPATPFVANFIGQTNLFPVKLRDGLAHFALGQHPVADAAASNLWISIRPEDLEMTVQYHTPDARWGEVIHSEFRGDCTFHTIAIDGLNCIVRSPVGAVALPGQRVGIRVRSADAVVTLFGHMP